MILINGECTDCPIGDGYFLKEGECLKCKGDCKKCSSTTTCEGCVPPLGQY